MYKSIYVDTNMVLNVAILSYVLQKNHIQSKIVCNTFYSKHWIGGTIDIKKYHQVNI